ncbi:hypothetical protein Pelo_10290 [Pelomyxa schiedti]|nr:hypothetical protein Pelo_10290 [Pelomyxa schiedti]
MTIALRVEPLDTVENLKQKIQDTTGIPPDLQRIIFAGATLRDDRTMTDIGVDDDTTMHMVLCNRGGGWETKSPLWKSVAPSVSTDTTSSGEIVFSSVGSKVSFFPLRTKGTNYVNLCTGLLKYAPDIQDTIWAYTSGPGWFCTKVNLSLASDSLEALTEHHKYIRDLKYVIGKYGKGYEGVVQRGVSLTKMEVQAYIDMGNKEFYIPSFTSASTTAPFGGKNTVIHFHMHLGVGFAILIQPEWTKYPNENEVLLSCYNVYKILSINTSTTPIEIHMEVLNYHDFHNDFANTHSLVNVPATTNTTSSTSTTTLF